MTVRFELQNVSKTFRRRRSGPGPHRLRALDGVSLALHDSQVCALTGSSGAGKSTLARVLLGIEPADSGRVLYRGRPLQDQPRREFNRANQLVFQNPFLAVNPTFCVRRIVSEPLRIAAIAPAAITEKVRSVLELLEVSERLLERRPWQLSGGELQRVALARALILEPGFLVLDEPFSSLDDLTAWRLLRRLKEIVGRLGLGVLFIGHHPRHVRFLAERVLVMENGRLLAP
jgi:ABC-type glutathione transport system ATPase component